MTTFVKTPLGSRDETWPRGARDSCVRLRTMAELLDEQAMEVEALESILMDDMQMVEGSEGIAGATHAPCYQIAVSALGDGEEEDPDDATQTARLGLVFSHTPAYPETPPLLRCRSIEGLFDAELVEVTERLRKHAEGLVGMAMIFDLATEAKEWMRGRAGVVDAVEETPEMFQRRLEEEAEERLKAMRAVGAPVTVESFNEWVTRFEAETGTAASAASAARERANRMTGRRYFEEKGGVEEEAEDESEAAFEDGEPEDESEEDESEDGGTDEEEDLHGEDAREC